MDKKRRWDIWDYLLWGGIISILIWAILKSLGMINTPEWVSMIPYFAGAIALVSCVFKAGKILQLIEGMDTDLKDLKTKTGEIDKSLAALSERVALREESIKKIDEEIREFTNPKK